MKVKMNREELKEGINKVGKILKNNIILNKRVYLEAKDGKVFLSGFQNNLGMRTVIFGAEMDEPFSCYFDVNLITAVLAKLPSPMVILDYNLKKTELCVQDGKAKSKVVIRCVDPKLYSQWKYSVEDADFEEETEDLFKHIGECKHALPTKNVNQILSCFCIQYGGGRWKVTALDGSRVASRGSIDNVEHTFLVPGEVFSLLESIYLDRKVTVSQKGEDLYLSDGQTIVILRTVSGNYFNLDHIVNGTFTCKVKIPRQEMLDAINLALISLMNQTDKKGEFFFDDKKNSLLIQAEDKIGNEMSSSLPIEGNLTKTLRMGFNMRYLIDAVKNISDEYLMIELSTEKTPIKISGEGYTEIILPVLLRS